MALPPEAMMMPGGVEGYINPMQSMMQMQMTTMPGIQPEEMIEPTTLPLPIPTPEMSM